MAQTGVERRPGAPWLDRLFETIPLAPPWLGLALAAALIGLYLLTMHATGDLAAFMQRDTHWWQDRDARLGLVLSLLVGYLPIARRYETLGTRRNLEANGFGRIWNFTRTPDC